MTVRSKPLTAPYEPTPQSFEIMASLNDLLGSGTSQRSAKVKLWHGGRIHHLGGIKFQIPNAKQQTNPKFKISNSLRLFRFGKGKKITQTAWKKVAFAICSNMKGIRFPF